MDQLFVKRHNLDTWFWCLVWIYAAVIIGFGFAPPVRDRFFDEFYQAVPDAIQSYLFKGVNVPPIRRAKFGDDSGVRGAAIVASLDAPQ